MLKLETIKKELEFCYPDKDFSVYEEKELIDLFNTHCENNKEYIEIKDLIDNYNNIPFVIDTPDGFQEVGDFYIKPEITIFEIITEKGYKTKCASNHKFETVEGWKFAEDITCYDCILTKEGFKKVEIINVLNKEKVYDFEVLHENHRYWSGNGMSSHNTGKTYVALSMCRMAQSMGYDILYCDSEGAIDIDTVRRIGVDTKRFIIQPVTTIQEFSHFAANLAKAVKDEVAAGKEAPKFMVVLDSLGNLSSTKEKDDMVSGSGARDMTKQQLIRGMFRVVGNDFAKLGIPWIINAHTYEKVGSYIPGKEISGGGGIIYNASVILMLSKAKLEDKESEDKAKKAGVEVNRLGIVVTATPQKSRFAKPIKVKFHIPFFKQPNPYVGLETYLSWESCGVVRGKLLTYKEYSKMSEVEQSTCYEMADTETGEIMYVWPRITARTLVCQHLGCEIPIDQLWTPKVFSEEVLRKLDENVIKPTFQLPSYESLDDISELTEEMHMDSENETYES
ncbi:MAG: hypothetical protein RSE41_04055 [Clostridia bacterium]